MRSRRSSGSWQQAVTGMCSPRRLPLPVARTATTARLASVSSAFRAARGPRPARLHAPERDAEMRRRLEEAARHHVHVEVARQALDERTRILRRRECAGRRRCPPAGARLRDPAGRRETRAWPARVGRQDPLRPRGQPVEHREGQHRQALGRERARAVHDVPRAANGFGHLRGRNDPAAAETRKPVALRQAARRDEDRRARRGRPGRGDGGGVKVDLVHQHAGAVPLRDPANLVQVSIRPRRRQTGCGRW